MSLFYSYIAGSLHVSGPQAHLQESSYSCSHNHWFTQSTQTERYRNWTNGYVNSCVNSPEDGPVGPKHVEIQQYTNKIVTSVGFHSISEVGYLHIQATAITLINVVLLLLLLLLLLITPTLQDWGARGSAVGWGTALQVGRSRVRFPMVSLQFFFRIILPAALWPWGWLSL